MYLATVRIYLAVFKIDLPVQERAGWGERMASLKGVWAIILLFAFVIGGIYGGIFTPSEAAGMGAAGAIIISAARGRLGWRKLFQCLLESIQVTAGIFHDPDRSDPVRLFPDHHPGAAEDCKLPAGARPRRLPHAPDHPSVPAASGLHPGRHGDDPS